MSISSVLISLRLWLRGLRIRSWLLVGGNTSESVVEKILEKVREDGYDPSEVIAFELQNLARPDVIAALEALVTTDAVEPVVAA